MKTPFNAQKKCNFNKNNIIIYDEQWRMYDHKKLTKMFKTKPITTIENGFTNRMHKV